MNIQKKNFILRYVPSMFRLQKGVREYLLETYSDLHYTAPNIYDQKVKASQGTVRGNRGLPGLLEYFNVNIYSSSLLNDERLLSPLAKNGKKYYKYRIDSVMGDPNNLDYRIRFIPRTKSDQLVGGYMIVSSNVWSVREIRFSGRSELITFTCWIKMGEVGKKDEFLPVRYDVEALFKFLGNKVDGNYTASLDYKSIELKERKVRKKEKKKYNLSESFSLQCDTKAYKTDASTFYTDARGETDIGISEPFHKFRRRHRIVSRNHEAGLLDGCSLMCRKTETDIQSVDYFKTMTEVEIQVFEIVQMNEVEIKNTIRHRFQFIQHLTAIDAVTITYTQPEEAPLLRPVFEVGIQRPVEFFPCKVITQLGHDTEPLVSSENPVVTEVLPVR